MRSHSSRDTRPILPMALRMARYALGDVEEWEEEEEDQEQVEAEERGGEAPCRFQDSFNNDEEGERRSTILHYNTHILITHSSHTHHTHTHTHTHPYTIFCCVSSEIHVSQAIAFW